MHSNYTSIDRTGDLVPVKYLERHTKENTMIAPQIARGPSSLPAGIRSIKNSVDSDFRVPLKSLHKEQRLFKS